MSDVSPGPLRIGRYLVHTILIFVPSICFPAALALDLAYIAYPEPFAASASQWCLAIGVGVALLAGAVGAIDYAGHEKIGQHRLTGPHMALAMTLIALESANYLVRYSYGSAMIGTSGLALSAVSVALMTGIIFLGRAVVSDLRPPLRPET